MPQDFETLNKQIAAFIIVSGAISAPVFADGGFAGGNNIITPSAQQDMLVRYAGPGMNIPIQVSPDMPIDRYAGPGLIPPTPSESQLPMVVKYAGPEMPKPPAPSTSSRIDQLKQLNDTDSLNVVNSADSVTAESSEEEHTYGQVKVAPGHFKFW